MYIQVMINLKMFNSIFYNKRVRWVLPCADCSDKIVKIIKNV